MVFQQPASLKGGGRKHNFKLVSAADLLSKPVSETIWTWEGILPEGGTSLCVAKPKVGKSTLALALSVAVARGEDFLGRETVKALVVYLALEEKESEIFKRLGAMGVRGEPIQFHFGIAPANGIKEIDSLVTETGAGLVVVDTLQKLARMRDVDAYSAVTKTLEPLHDVARRNNCHIMLLHHAGKDNDRTDGDEILGSTALLGAVDTALIIKKGGRGRSFYTKQRYGEDIPETVIVLNDDYSMRAEGTLAEAQVRKTWEKIRSLLELQPDLSMKEIIEHTGAGKGDISKALQWAFKQDNLVKRSGSGKRGDPFLYSLPYTHPHTVREKPETPETLMNTNSILPKDTIRDFSGLLGESCVSPVSPGFSRKKSSGRIDVSTTGISGPKTDSPFPPNGSGGGLEEVEI